MAEEIALHLVLDAAAGIVADETPELELFTGGMPKSRFDFDFDLKSFTRTRTTSMPTSETEPFSS